MPKLIFDIETIGEDFDRLDDTTQEILTRWIKKESDGEPEYQTALEELKNGMGFSPLTGEIVAIGVLDSEKDKGVVYYQHPGKEGEESEEDGIKFKAMSEKEMLEKFWEGAKSYDEFVTFNGRGFDVTFIMVRSAVHGIRPSKDLLSNRYLSLQKFGSKHVDLLDQLSFYGAVYRNKGNLHMWTRAFGITSPKAGGVTGDDVGRLFKEGEFLKIAQYNVGDLRATRDLYRTWEEYLRF
ncbi:MAG: ribonuclease H-like domain-containing protein [bacterium]|nr:ribonuclease H-like domain-containing protein [bacterium]